VPRDISEMEVRPTRRYVKIWELEGFTDDDGRLLKVVLSPKTQGTGRFSLSVVVAPPGTRGPVHVHEESDEFWYILDGRGEIIIGDERVPVEPDMLIHGPANIPHQLINSSKDPLRAIFIFSPAGPEEKFVHEMASVR